MTKEDQDILYNFLLNYKHSFYNYCTSVDVRYDFYLQHAVVWDVHDEVIISIISVYGPDFIKSELEKLFNINLYFLSRDNIGDTNKDITRWSISKNAMQNIIAICRIFGRGNVS